jgi:hypothetical protein
MLSMGDRDKLIKLLMMTTSDFDGEALSFIRKANELLKRNSLSWEQVLNQQSNPVDAKKPAPEPPVHPQAMNQWQVNRIFEVMQILNSFGIDARPKHGLSGIPYFTISYEGQDFQYWPLTEKAVFNKKTYHWNLTSLAMRLRVMKEGVDE